MNDRRIIFHVDMDAFFAAIAQLDHPELRGKPVLTGGNGPRGVVSTASYEARVFGCRSAMPMAQAKKRCPQAVVVPVPPDRIREMSDKLFELLDNYSPLVEPVSVDEAFLDMTGSIRLMGSPIDIAAKLKSQIQNELQLTASVGVSYNKFLAKLASDMNKPDGLTIINPNDIDRVLLPMPVSSIWGVGPATCQALEKRGIRTIGELSRLTESQLGHYFGEYGRRFYELARGIDHRPVVPDHTAKSISQEETFPQDIDDHPTLRNILLGQVEQVARRLRKHELAARTINLKIRTGLFHTITRSATLDEATNLTGPLWTQASALFDTWVEDAFHPLRLLGVTASALQQPDEQLPLFTDPQRVKLKQLDQALDRIADRFGKHTIRRAAATSRRSQSDDKRDKG